jgi:hypothetical protein
MKDKTCIRMLLTAVCVIIISIPSLAGNTPTGSHQTAVHSNADAAANAPWFFDTVETFPPDPPSPAYDVG